MLKNGIRIKKQARELIQSLSSDEDEKMILPFMAAAGGYRDALKFTEGSSITFDPETFVQSRPSSMQPFLENMLHLQIFQQVHPLLVFVLLLLVSVRPLLVSVRPLLVSVHPLLVSVRPLLVSVRPLLVSVRPLLVRSLSI